MRPSRYLSMAAGLCALAACGSNGRDRIADKVQHAADARADAMEEASERMTNALARNNAQAQAKLTREAGQDRASAIRDSQLNTSRLSEVQKNALIKGAPPPGTATAPPR